MRRMLLLAAMLLAPLHYGMTQDLSDRDLQVIGRALGFVERLPAGSQIAILHTPGNAAARAEAEKVQALIGAGLKAGSRTLKPKLVALGGDLSDSAAIFATAGLPSNGLLDALRLSKLPCVTIHFDYMRDSACVMAIRSQPRVDIVVSVAAAQVSDTAFSAAFRMLIREQ